MFRKLFFLLPLAAFLSTTVHAQFRYAFKDTTTAYLPLPETATSVNGNTIWKDYYSFTIPMPFTWSLDSAAQKAVFNLYMGFLGPINDEYMGLLTGFSMARAIFVDRGYGDTIAKVSRSPIRYLTTGTAPNRIFKVELANVGFLTEEIYYGTLEDYTDQQIWIYEGSSIVEMHYGPSRINNFDKCFDNGTGGVSLNIGLFKDILYNSSGSIHYLIGPPTSLSVKSVVYPTDPKDGLNSWPLSGTVFRFTPIRKVVSGIANLTALGNIKVYPNPTTDLVTVEGASTGTRATLYSMLGQAVLQTTLAGKGTLDISNLPAGVYKLVLTNKESVNSATTIMKE